MFIIMIAASMLVFLTVWGLGNFAMYLLGKLFDK